VGWKVQLE
jgi:hypothetical protein